MILGNLEEYLQHPSGLDFWPALQSHVLLDTPNAVCLLVVISPSTSMDSEPLAAASITLFTASSSRVNTSIVVSPSLALLMIVTSTVRSVGARFRRRLLPLSQVMLKSHDVDEADGLQTPTACNELVKLDLTELPKLALLHESESTTNRMVAVLVTPFPGLNAAESNKIRYFI